ncbi:MAG: glutamate--cysteine ligase, partial [Gammaproteobacteria bacterium]|nr:glutamate--cysteine ligase [Gammaproteobacteria bacterium]
MGQEIAGSHFSATDFENFDARLRKETAQLTDWFEQGAFSSRHGMGGFELESWLVDSDNQPAPLNETYLAMLNDALVSPELSRFNVELNSTPRSLQGDALAAMQRELEQNWHHCRETAQKLNADLVMIGILPTVKDRMLTLSNMSNMERYRALNEQVFRLREGRPIMLDIQGMESLHSEHHDVMLESAATSFQIHIQTALDKAVRYYNASIILSAPMVAISANSPLLFGKRLWHET